MIANQIRKWKIHNFLFLALLFGFYGCAGTEVTPVRNYEKCPFYGGIIERVQVSNSGPWQESGVIVNIGDELFFEAEGRWSFGPGNSFMCSPAGRVGTLFPEQYVLPNAPDGALIGRTGGSLPFLIGAQSYHKVSTPGALYLAMNDLQNWYHDNKPICSIAVTIHHKKTSLMQDAIQTKKYVNTQSTTTPWGDIPVVSYRFDAQTRNGELSVDITGKGIEVRKWIVENIGEICSSQNIVLEAGKEPTQGGRYQILKESVENGILTIEFQALY